MDLFKRLKKLSFTGNAKIKPHKPHDPSHGAHLDSYVGTEMKEYKGGKKRTRRVKKSRSKSRKSKSRSRRH